MRWVFAQSCEHLYRSGLCVSVEKISGVVACWVDNFSKLIRVLHCTKIELIIFEFVL